MTLNDGGYKYGLDSGKGVLSDRMDKKVRTYCYRLSASIGLDVVGWVSCISGARSSSPNVLCFVLRPQVIHLHIFSVKRCPLGTCNM